MPVSNDTLKAISTMVRSGFYDRARVIEIFCEERKLNRVEAEAAVDSAIQSHNAEKAAWPQVTDFDRLDTAFSDLRSLGIIGLHNAGYEDSDGHTYFHEAYAEAADHHRIIGYCFYHWQDLEHAVGGRGLYLAFGPADPGDEDTRGLWVGRIIADQLRRVGLEVQWDGTFKTRILIPSFDWKRR